MDKFSDIDQKELSLIVDRLVDVYHPLRIYLFGSHAWGTPSDESDCRQSFCPKCSVAQSLSPFCFSQTTMYSNSIVLAVLPGTLLGEFLHGIALLLIKRSYVIKC